VGIMVRRWFLSKKEVKTLRRELSKLYPNIPLEFKRVEKVIEKGLGEIIVVDGVPSFYMHEDKYYPLLTLLLEKGYEWLPYVIVDMGAVKPLLRGADIMAPGIKEVHGEFKENEPVVVVEEKYRKPFVVARSLVKSETLVKGIIKRGKVLENIHRIGDRVWKLAKSL